MTNSARKDPDKFYFAHILVMLILQLSTVVYASLTRPFPHIEVR